MVSSLSAIDRLVEQEEEEEEGEEEYRTLAELSTSVMSHNKVFTRPTSAAD